MAPEAFLHHPRVTWLLAVPATSTSVLSYTHDVATVPCPLERMNTRLNQLSMPL